MQQPRVLVTGGAGYIGSHACKALAAAGYVPVSYDNLEHGHEWAVKWGPSVNGDLRDTDLLKRTLERHSISAVMHFAAYCYVGESMTAPEKYFRNNVANSIELLDATRECGVRQLVFSSTCATYGVPVRLPIDEEHPQTPINPYGESKLMVENMLRWQEHAYGLKWSALRYFNAAGADADGDIGEDHSPETHLIPLAIQAALGQRAAVDVYGTDYPTADGTAIRDYIHVTDLAQAHVKALQRLQSGGPSIALNLGTGLGHSVRQVLEMVRAVSEREFAVRNASRRAGDPPELVADARRAFDILQWRPQHSSLRNIVETAWRWHSRAHVDAAH
ncbi:MAG TPA: UDP-glucose 4-epimerase GalE [Burkholderiales bacterium]|nr:UDP-glucose 4-epimerase GalE [Burkholderiales bacterium]